jgi:predicted nuclease of predicted toxin-antitoxin system
MPTHDLKFLLDENIHVGVGEVLADMKYDARIIRLNDPGLIDREIINLSIQEKRIIITQDLDFGELVYFYRLKPEGVILIRVHPSNLESQKRAIIEILTYLDKMKIDIREKFVVFHDQTIRVREIKKP